MSRFLVLLLGIIAYIVSIGFSKSAGFFDRALYAYTIYGAAITPALVAALFWRGATKEGAVASIICGTLITLFWKELPGLWFWLPTEWYISLDEVLPAISGSLLALICVSYLTKKTDSGK